MLTSRTLTEQQTLIRRQFTDFFESERFEEKYHRRIQAMMHARQARLILDMGDLLDFTPANALLPGEMLNGVNGSGSGNAAQQHARYAAVAAVSGGIANPASLGAGVLYEPATYVPLLELALHDVVVRQQPEYLKVDYRHRAVHAGFDGPVGCVRSPRELYARHLNTMVALEGVVTRQSSNRPRVLETVHYCAATNKFTRKEFRDQLTPMLDSAHLPTVNVMPKTDMDGHVLRTELGLSTFVDSQCAVLQEAPERAPTGQLPRQVELRFDDDLVDRVKPGDRVVVVGVYMPYTSVDSKRFETIVLVNHVVPMYSNNSNNNSNSDNNNDNNNNDSSSSSSSLVAATRRTRVVRAFEERLVQFARKCTQQLGPCGVLHSLAHGIAPTVYGLTHEKRAILLLLVGGVERRAHHTHIRGDINVLLVGEPGTAKSQLLRFVLGVAPLALSTTGKGSSGVGLTAAVTVDGYTGERALSAGAMVLADRGILCVDEFDKMSPPDRVAMHEAMEQQTVTIAKAGIHASLNARCSVLAAANPIYGFYSVHHRLAYNVGLPESLLSRFDLTFIILDQHSSNYNRRIGLHILRNHMTARPVGLDTVVARTLVDSVAEDDGGMGSSGSGSGSHNNSAAAVATGGSERDTTQQQHQSSSSSPLTAGHDATCMTSNSTGAAVVRVDFLRAYVQYAKQFTPLLTEASQQLVSQHYVQLRAEQQQQQQGGSGGGDGGGGGGGGRDGFFVTARTLEAIVRLATAHAKLRLSTTVDEDDVGAAMTLLRASVHAAATAVQQRDEDNAQIMQHPSQHGGDGSSAAAAAAGASRKRGLDVMMADGASSTRTGRGGGGGGGGADSDNDNSHSSHSTSAAGAAAVTSSDGSMTAAVRGDDAMAQTTAAAASLSSSSSSWLSRAVLDALRAVRREQRSSLRVRELPRYLPSHAVHISDDTRSSATTTTATAASVPGTGGLSLRELQRAVCALQGDLFVVESVDDAGEDVIQLL